MTPMGWRARQDLNRRYEDAERRRKMAEAPQVVTHALTLMHPRPEAILEYGCRLLWVPRPPSPARARGFVAIHTSGSQADAKFIGRQRERHGLEFSPESRHKGKLVGVYRIADALSGSQAPDRRHPWSQWWPGTWGKDQRVLVLSDVQSLRSTRKHSGRPGFWLIKEETRRRLNYQELRHIPERMAFRANRTPYVDPARGLVGLALSEDEIPDGAHAIPHVELDRIQVYSNTNPDWVVLASEVLATTEGPVKIYGGSHHG